MIDCREIGSPEAPLDVHKAESIAVELKFDQMVKIWALDFKFSFCLSQNEDDAFEL